MALNRERIRVDDRKTLARFENTMLPHLAAAYNLARWLTRNAQDAEDVVQEAYSRAWQFFEGFRGGDAQAWLLAIVRNTSLNSLHRKQAHRPPDPLGEEAAGSDTQNPELILMQKEEAKLLRDAIEELPAEQREVVILRELQELPYKEIAAVTGLPLGTVMSRLARGRAQLQERLAGRINEET